MNHIHELIMRPEVHAPLSDRRVRRAVPRSNRDPCIVSENTLTLKIVRFASFFALARVAECNMQMR